MNRKLIINERGRKIVFKQRMVRTPVHLTVNNSEFKLLEVQLRLQGIVDYTIVDIDVKGDDLTVERYEPTIEDIKLEEPEKSFTSRELNTILERLASDKWKL